MEQLFQFQTRGGEDVSLRPEVTPSVARMIGAKMRDFPRPVKWFEIGQCFRYEKPQKGRGREFYQWNVDILGEESPGADAEVIALAIDCMKAFGLGPDDFSVRISDRRIWDGFAVEKGIGEEEFEGFLRIIDKWEKLPEEKLAAMLKPSGVSYREVVDFMADPSLLDAVLEPVSASLAARGLGGFLKQDPTIVRGLAYYTGVVFEIFDLRGDLRAIAGGGRYDSLVKLIDGKSEMPAVGFAMGDMVIGLLIEQAAASAAQLKDALPAQADAYVVVGDEPQRPDALRLVQELREAGVRTDMPLSAVKFGKQFGMAEARGASGRGYCRPRVSHGEGAESGHPRGCESGRGWRPRRRGCQALLEPGGLRSRLIMVLPTLRGGQWSLTAGQVGCYLAILLKDSLNDSASFFLMYRTHHCNQLRTSHVGREPSPSADGSIPTATTTA